MDNELLRLQIRVRVARFRLEGLAPGRADWRVARAELTDLELEMARQRDPAPRPVPDSHPT
jgi:hypothetical protein